MARPVVVLLTDYGDDAYVGVLKGVIATRAPEARVIDLTHRVPQGAVAAGARILADAAPSFPARSIFCCVVDPGVGGPRRRLVARTSDGARFVAPDNGLLARVLESDRKAEVRALENPAWTFGPPTATFEGRSHFAPAAAALAAGARFASAGPRVADFTRLRPARLDVAPGRVVGEVEYVDAFGNLVTSIDAATLSGLGDSARLVVVARPRRGARASARATGVARTFADVAVGATVAYLGSAGRLELATRDGSLAAAARLGAGAEVEVVAASARRRRI